MMTTMTVTVVAMAVIMVVATMRRWEDSTYLPSTHRLALCILTH